MYSLYQPFHLVGTGLLVTGASFNNTADIIVLPFPTPSGIKFVVNSCILYQYSGGGAQGTFGATGSFNGCTFRGYTKTGTLGVGSIVFSTNLNAGAGNNWTNQYTGVAGSNGIAPAFDVNVNFNSNWPINTCFSGSQIVLHQQTGQTNPYGTGIIGMHATITPLL